MIEFTLIEGLIIVVFLVLYYLSVETQFTNMFIFTILVFLGYYPLAILCLGMSLVLGTGIIKDTIGHRANTFKEQNLQESTKLHHRKFIVVCKTLYYYTKLCLFPKRMGLYHVYNYYYSKKTEEEDYTFWLGFILLIGIGAGFYFGSFAVRFGLLWYISFIVIFLNWITIHQFVAERYCYVGNIGLCLILALVLVHFPFVMAFVCGLALMRTWVHLPTFGDEIPFYQSNIWNFPASEVAFANLGVTYMKRGLIGSAVDMWLIGTNINPNYDVAWYNLSSTLKTKGQLGKSLEFLKKAIESPQCHFKETWVKELQLLEHEMGYLKELDELQRQLTKIAEDPKQLVKTRQIQARFKQVNELHIALKKDRESKLVLVQQQQSSIEIKRIELKKVTDLLKKTIPIEDMIKMRDQQFKLVKEDALRHIKGVIHESSGGGVHTTGREGKPGSTSDGVVETS